LPLASFELALALKMINKAPKERLGSFNLSLQFKASKETKENRRNTAVKEIYI